MEVAKINVNVDNGMHLRVAARVVNASKRYKSKILLCHKCKFADACSILELVSLAVTKSSEIAVVAEGPDEKEAVKEIGQLFIDGAGI